MLIPNSFRIFAETKHRYTFLYSFSRSCSGLYFNVGVWIRREFANAVMPETITDGLKTYTIPENWK